jgi:hypothetical protein
MPRKETTQYSATSIGFELPTAQAKLTIILVDLAGSHEPVRWPGERISIAVRLKKVVLRLINRS